MEQTLVILKPAAVHRHIMGEVISRFEKKGLYITGMKMMQLDESILREHYAHLVEKPFFPSLLESMMSTPVVVMCVEGKDAVEVVRLMVGATNGRKALPGTIRGDFSMSGQENIVHASDSVDNAQIELARFFRKGEILDYRPSDLRFYYAPDESK
ncbi:nucleoside-diphosphate kinase [uncultured Muribaculum sp.]|uniref:nucleoside-diphosphate kinase n=1 Tax=uncultured Muribaculum sp. TaxID=1918613 RepID=UPI0025EDDE45|nr:nucleoside-diphosphate kinase [uncultured Muribaculum sp.]